MRTEVFILNSLFRNLHNRERNSVSLHRKRQIYLLLLIEVLVFLSSRLAENTTHCLCRVIRPCLLPYKNDVWRTSLVVQWLRTCLLMHGMLIQSLVWEDNTCRGATKPMLHSDGACVLQPLKQLLKPVCPKATEMRSPQTTTRESPCMATKTGGSQ